MAVLLYIIERARLLREVGEWIAVHESAPKSSAP
jgi:hypothetical protein